MSDQTRPNNHEPKTASNKPIVNLALVRTDPRDQSLVAVGLFYNKA